MRYISLDDKLKAIEDILKTNLNVCIRENNIQKPDLPLSEIADTAYLYNVREVPNVSQFCVLEIARTEPRSISAKGADVVYINIFVGFSGENQTSNDNMFKAYRYESCIKEAIVRSRNPRYKYEGCIVDGLTIGNRKLYGAMCTYSIEMI